MANIFQREKGKQELKEFWTKELAKYEAKHAALVAEGNGETGKAKRAAKVVDRCRGKLAHYQD